MPIKVKDLIGMDYKPKEDIIRDKLKGLAYNVKYLVEFGRDNEVQNVREVIESKDIDIYETAYIIK